MSEQIEKRGPGRPSNAELAARAQSAVPQEYSRSEETKARRRRRETLGEERNLKLFVPSGMKDPNFEYRWVNDRAGRVRQLTVDDDWDVVDTAKLGGDPDPEKNTAEGTVMARVGDKFTGERMTLLRKPKEYYTKDREDGLYKRLRQVEDDMRRGAPQGGGENLGAQDNAYVPGTGRNIVGGK